jgi:hypothetical protein
MADWGERRLFSRVEGAGRALNSLPPVPGRGSLDVNNARIHGEDTLTVLEAAQESVRLHVWSPSQGWESHELPRGVQVKSASLGGDGTPWLAGRDDAGPALWFGHHLAGPWTRLEVRLGLSARLKLWFSDSRQQCDGIYAEGVPLVMRVDPGDLFSSPTCHVLLQQTDGTWVAHRMPFAVEILPIAGGTMFVTLDGAVHRADAEGHLVLQASAETLRNAVARLFSKSDVSPRIFRADALDAKTLLAVVEHEPKGERLPDALFGSGDGGQTWSPLLSPEVGGSRETILAASWIR